MDNFGEHTDWLVQLLSWAAALGGAALVALRAWGDQEACFAEAIRQPASRRLPARLPPGSIRRAEWPDRCQRPASVLVASLSGSPAPPGPRPHPHDFDPQRPVFPVAKRACPHAVGRRALN